LFIGTIKTHNRTRQKKTRLPQLEVAT